MMIQKWQVIGTVYNGNPRLMRRTESGSRSNEHALAALINIFIRKGSEIMVARKIHFY
jgi:hypothetical protein